MDWRACSLTFHLELCKSHSCCHISSNSHQCTKLCCTLAIKNGGNKVSTTREPSNSPLIFHQISIKIAFIKAIPLSRQEYGVDFEKVFLPIVKMMTLGFLLGVATSEDLELLQLDVKTAFLHGDLDKEIYIEQPQGFASLDREHLVCHLCKTLYGLKQAPRQWYKKFNDFIKPRAGFLRSDEDHCLCSKETPDGSPIFLILYGDHLLLFGQHLREIAELR